MKGFFPAEIRNSKVFLAEIRWSQKKRSSPTLSELRNQNTTLFWSKQRQVLHNFGSQIPLGGAVFHFWSKNRPQKHKKVLFCILFRPIGRLELPPPSPWLRYWFYASWSSGNAFVSGAGSLRFKSRASQIGHSGANGSPPLRYFSEKSCVARAQWREDGPRKLVTLLGVLQRG